METRKYNPLFLLVIFIMIGCLNALGQCPPEEQVTIVGPTTVVVGQTDPFSIAFAKDPWCPTPTGDFDWDPGIHDLQPNATETDCEIRWTQRGDDLIMYSLIDGLDFYWGELYIHVNGPPLTPVVYDATDIGPNSFTVSWQPSDGADYYSLKVTDDNWNSYLSGYDGSVFITETSHTITDLNPFVNYKFMVVAGNQHGESDFSSEKSALYCANPPPPDVEFSVSTNECGNKTISYSGTFQPGVSWFWQGTNPNGTDVSTQASALTYQASIEGTNTYYLRAKTTVCGNYWSSTSSSVEVTVNTTPAAPATPIESIPNSCGAITLTKNGTSSGGVLWYWQGTNASGQDYTSSQATAEDYVATLSGANTYYIRARSSTGCWSANSTGISVTTIPGPPAARIDSEGLSSICVGDTVMLLAFKEEGYSSFQWIKDGVEISGATQDKFKAAQQGNYKVRITSTRCHPSFTTNTSGQFAVITNTKPNAVITHTGSATICEGSSLVLNGSTGTGYIYQWRRHDGIDTTYVDIEGATASSYTAKTAGSYKLITKLGGCSSESSAKVITITRLPIAIIAPSGATTLCPGQTIKLMAFGDFGTYQWKNGSSIISGATTNSYTTGSAGVYRAIVTKSGCSTETNPITVAQISPPLPVTEVNGTSTLPVGDKQVYTISGGSDADLFLWNTPQGVNITYQNAQRSSALIGFTSLGEKVISVSAQKNGCDSAPIEKTITVNETTSFYPSQIPAELKVSPENQHVAPVVQSPAPLSLNNIAQDQVRQVMENCSSGEYLVAFQLYYDLADRNTTQNWTALVEITFQQGASTILWTRTVQVDMATQTFVSTIFHDAPITCTGDYRYKIKTKNTNIGGIQAPEQNIYLKVIYHKRLTDVFSTSASLSLNYQKANNMVEASWSYTGNAVRDYDLEWVFIEDHEGFTGTAQQAFLFKEPVRITTAQLSYKFNEHFPKGKMWFRARATGFNSQYPSHRILGNWFYGPGTALPVTHLHEANTATRKNWQMQTIFAEEGKYKKIVSYYDGTLRQRQVQTNLSTGNLTLVGEPLYDFEGRKAGEILPVPVNDLQLAFKSNFNTLQSNDPTVIANTSSTKKKFHYDNRELVNSIISETTGAGKYYSENNTISSQHKDYIPDADGYVLSQTEYLNDATGRATRQSGVGEMFRMEGGHATRYYYAEPSRIELTRLFGTNVGNASHYKKNVVVDPNGQVSVSYLDQTDKVIATALAGTPPTNVESLPSYQQLPTAPITVDLMSKNAKGNSISQTTHKFLNESPNTTYTINYNLSALGSVISNFGCQSCVYDFTISITDPDGKLLDLSAVAGNESGGTTYQRKNLTAANCTTPSSLSSVVINLLLTEVGDYTITKTLNARELSFDQVKTILLQNASVQTQITAITNGYVVDPQDCAICTSCPEADAAINEAIDEIAEADCENILQEIIQKLHEANASNENYEPTETEIKSHALYCKYEVCLKEKSSTIFDKQMARVDRWSVATDGDHLYQNLVNITTNTANPTMDPFFTEEESLGYPYRQTMQSKINSIGIKGTTFTGGSLSQVTDPLNTAYYVNPNGAPDPEGYHVLYYSLMKKRSQMGEALYQEELDKQRWTLFRNFYMDLKRKVKLLIPDYTTNCPEAKKDLDKMDELPQSTSDMNATRDAITLWGKNNGVEVPVSDAELEMAIYRITRKCGITLSAAHLTSIANELRAYFNSNLKNFLRLIFINDVGVHPNLNAIQAILNTYGSCSLSSIAAQDPMTCIETVTPTLPGGPNLISNSSFTGCPINQNITASCSGWKPAYGTPYLQSDKGFKLEATNCAHDALMGYLTTALDPQKKYRLTFKYKTTSVIASAYISLSRSTAFNSNNGAPPPAQGGGISPMMMYCPSWCNDIPGVQYKDPVTFEDGSSSSDVWSMSYSAQAPYQQVEIVFSPSQASTYIFFYHQLWGCNYQTALDIIFKDIDLRELEPTGPAFCINYDANNPTLALWKYEVNLAAEIANCNLRAQEEKTYLVQYAVDDYLEEQASTFLSTYRTNCLNSATEQLSITYTPKEYHYTLYYYDQAGSLVQTVPPAGVVPLDFNAANSATPPPTTHTLLTKYQYGSLDQLLVQITPDAGKSEFFYDKKGQLRISRNAQQAVDNKYSYTKYDRHGRITEVGELEAAVLPVTIIPYIEDSRFPTTGVAELPTYPLADVTRTYYDLVNENILTKLIQQNLRGRVSWVEVTDKSGPDKTSTHYSYDIHGHVKSLVQEIPGLETKRTDYAYDLISGKMNFVFYQYGKQEQFIHKYSYDSDNRLTSAFTSSDAYIWNKEAFYQYYAHGPLARTEYGHYRVQGQDFYYTLQGWIKGVNMPYDGDPNQDGLGGSAVGKDVYAYALGYFQNDYKASNPSVVLSDSRDQQWVRYNALMNNSGLYNGNISWMITDLLKIGDVNGNRAKGMQAMLYRYDQLQRIKRSMSLTSYVQGTGFASRAAIPAAYDEMFSYDANGNMLTLQRYNDTGALMDDFNYQYYANSNKLRYIKPIVNDLTINSGPIGPDNHIYRNITLTGNAYVPAGSTVQLLATEGITVSPTVDIQQNADFNIRTLNAEEGNYMYDKLGNLVKDNDGEVIISWTPYGKVREVKKMNSADVTSFLYDGAGNRVCKKVVKAGVTTITHYVRDASGRVMGVYTNNTVTERHIYGGSRLGSYKGGVVEGHVALGKRTFELTNHLGNVLTVITDNVGMNGAEVWAKVINTSDYYVFGLEMAQRIFTDEAAYRYGFNGKEKDGNSDYYDYGDRIYSPRIGRWLSVDPLQTNFAYWGPYNFAANSPLVVVDENGRNPILIWAAKGALGAVIDASMQFVFNLILFNGDADQAFKNIDWYQVGKSGLESIFGAPGGRWGSGAVVAATDIAFNTARGKYAGMNSREVTEKVAVDFIIGYLSHTLANEAGAQLKKAMPKIAKWLATKGLEPSTIKKLTGRWSIKPNPATPKGSELTEDLANYLDDELGDVVQDVDKKIFNGKQHAGDIDILLENVNVQVKSSVTNSKDILSKADYKETIASGKSFILFVKGKISEGARKDLESNGVRVVTTREQLRDAVSFESTRIVD